MEETVHYKGVLKKVERLEGESLEEQCKRLLDNKDLPFHLKSYQEYLVEKHYREMTIQNGVVYRVEKEKGGSSEVMFDASQEANEEIAFELRYFDSDYDFDAALEKAIKRINQ